MAALLLVCGGAAQAVVLYQNDFENPQVDPPPDLGLCSPDLSQASVNSLYGPEFQQQYTVETIAINGPANQYNDPLGTGGNYSLGMLSDINDDKVALTFDSQGQLYLNLSMDISAININGCGGPPSVNQPTFEVTLYDTPGGAGTFDFDAPGAVLSTFDLQGYPSTDPYVFNWKRVAAPLSTTGTINGTVTVVLDLAAGAGYASFDNLVIDASDTPASGNCPGPRGGCRSAAKSILLIRDQNDSAKDKLIWKWINGDATTQQELGDPINSADYALCLYSGTTAAFLAEAFVPADDTKWSEVPDKGYKYKDKNGTASGVQKIVIKGSTGNKAKALVKGKGGGLPDPTLGSLPLPITAQLVNSDTSVCLEARYDTTDVIKNNVDQFKAKAQQP